MKIFREAIIILGIYLLGEILSKTLGIPLPGNILGMIILLLLLCTKVIKLSQIETISKFLLDHLAFFFIPAGVGIMASFGLISGIFLKLTIICIITTFIVMGVTALVVQFIENHKGKEEKSNGSSN